MKKAFSPAWKASSQPRKQRKYAHNAPLHIKQKMLHAHLSPELRKKYAKRNVQLRKGDKVKIMRGKFKGKEAAVDRIILARGKVYIVGMEYYKKEGSKVPVAFNASNLMITSLDLKDNKRKQKLTGEKSRPAVGAAKETKDEKKK
ncbi:50S ribosomal protein L24 [Candidatus Woesearchaeota archaeon CG10_big_fil_rev_8_21_14_0_10_45_16]|nr:MAG: 50S ribosomal protein L24 [Candidatus Woesearchaeota archaeon CG10_big_fil_rev_8_21_14_0_10_45_16]